MAPPPPPPFLGKQPAGGDMFAVESFQAVSPSSPTAGSLDANNKPPSLAANRSGLLRDFAAARRSACEVPEADQSRSRKKHQ